MSIQHSAITNANLHENKGVSAASNDTVATATTGATVWKKLTVANLDTAAFFRTNKFTLNVTLADVSTADTIYLVIPVAATVNKVWSVLSGAITTADATVTIKNAAGTSMGTLTITQSGSAAGDVDSLTPVSNNTFTAGTALRITTDGACDTTRTLNFTIELTQTA